MVYIVPMENSELLLMVNALLVSLLGIGVSMLSFFLKDVYRDHKKLQDKVNTLQREASTHQRLFQEHIQLIQLQAKQDREQLEQLKFLSANKNRVNLQNKLKYWSGSPM